MEFDLQQNLARLIRMQRIAAFGTLREGAPLVSMILYAVSPDFAQFYIHASRLALHTQDILNDPRASLMIAETDTGEKDPQTLARVSIRGEVVAIPTTHSDYAKAKTVYLEKFPDAAFNFTLGDFSIYKITPRTARYVAGFGKIFNLTVEDFKQAAL
ncbi:pyridoxamine 5'-phosphate oxidase family protein [candidate division KSB1 bacterium]|nr:pyridoxamine 5'-phosphate oxidase family protein [candidate division KSB1 bacterium]